MKNNFAAWIYKAGGTLAVAKRFGKSQKTIQHWITGYSRPKLKDAERILKLAGEELTLSDILKPKRVRK